MGERRRLRIVLAIMIVAGSFLAVPSMVSGGQQGEIDSVKVTPALPDSVLPGGTLTFTCWVRNTGAVPIVDGNASYAIWNPDNAHVASHGTGPVITLRPGETDCCTTAVTVPGGAMPGSYNAHASFWNAQGKRLAIWYGPALRVGDTGQDYMRFRIVSCDLSGYDSTDAQCAYYDYGDVVTTEWRVTNIGSASGWVQRYSSCGLPHLGGAAGVSEQVYFQANGADTIAFPYSVIPPRPGAWAIDINIRQKTCPWNRRVHYAWWPNVYNPVVIGKSAYIPAIYPKMLYYAPFSEVSVVTETWNRGTEDLNALVHLSVYDGTGANIIYETTGYLPIQAPPREWPWYVEAETTWVFTLPFAEVLGKHKIEVEVSDTVAGGLMLLDRHNIWFKVPHLIYVEGQAEHYEIEMENGESRTLELELYNLLNSEETFDLTLEGAPPRVSVSPSSVTIPKEGETTGSLVVNVPWVPGATEYTFKVKMESTEDPNIYDYVEVKLMLNIVIVARGLKEDGLAELEGVLESVTQPQLRHHLECAKLSLEQSLEWFTDYSHADPRHGHKVFKEEKKVVNHMALAAKHAKLNGMPDFIEDFREIAVMMANADRLLAAIALDEAEANPGADPDQIARGTEEMAKGVEKLEEPDPEMANHGIEWNQYDNAIDHFKKAWEHAQAAVDGQGGAQSAGRGEMARTFALSQNQPNPFGQFTTINYQLPRPGHTTLRVYDALGRLVATLVDGKVPAGVYSVTWETDGPPSGIYFYKLSTGDYIATRKMLVLK